MSGSGTTTAQMQAVMQALEQILPGCGLVLLVAPHTAPSGQRVNYVSNGKREEMIAMLKEVTARFEGRAHAAPEAKQ